MSNIILISTRHDEVGVCTSEALCGILLGIKPEVIFEEMPPSFFDMYYGAKTRFNLESNAVSLYLEHISVPHIPVDSDKMPSEAFFQLHRQTMERVESLAGEVGFTFRNLVDQNRHHTATHGFRYLNSQYSIAYNDEIYTSIEKGLEVINSEMFFNVQRQWNEIHNAREIVMLNNIIQYSQANAFNKAVFLLGASHRKSFIEKAYAAVDQMPNLTWHYFGESLIK